MAKATGKSTKKAQRERSGARSLQHRGKPVDLDRVKTVEEIEAMGELSFDAPPVSPAELAERQRQAERLRRLREKLDYLDDIKMGLQRPAWMKLAVPAEPTTTSNAAPAERHGPQIDRAMRDLIKLYPPDGKAPRSLSAKTVRGELERRYWKDENKKHGSVSPSEDVVSAAMKQLGRRDG